jgi:hypothetical protein
LRRCTPGVRFARPRAVLGVGPGDASEYAAIGVLITAAASTIFGGFPGFLQIFRGVAAAPQQRGSACE